ncbi:MAG TPA: hypothetical protein PLD59_17905 [Tepidisphaeraceae bacterium]|nr:hypothetical protein [Tepidisphaeraceae bacterium]
MPQKIRPNRHRITPPKADPRIARKQVRRWMKWFIPPAIVLATLLALRVDASLIAVCVLAFPVVIIRAVQAWGDYQTACAESLPHA